MVIFMEPSRRVKLINLSGIRKMFELVGEDSINLGLGEPDFDTPPHIIEAAKKALDEGFTHYTVNKGIIELRNAISTKLEEDNRIYCRSRIYNSYGGCQRSTPHCPSSIDK
jgi:aspartate aminotransferase